MGYYTEYYLQVRNVKDTEEFIRLCLAIQNHQTMHYAFDAPYYPKEKSLVMFIFQGTFLIYYPLVLGKSHKIE